MNLWRASLRGRIFILMSMALLAALSFGLDGDVRFDARHQSPSLIHLANFVSKAGDFLPLMAGVILVLVWSLVRKSRTLQKLTLCMLLAGALSGLSADLLKYASGRSRPQAGASQGWFGPMPKSPWGIQKYQYASFPSGHVAFAAGLLGVAAVYNPALVAAVWGMITSIAWSRLYLGSHYFSDVICAAVLGVLSANLVWKLIGERWISIPSPICADEIRGGCPEKSDPKACASEF